MFARRLSTCLLALSLHVMVLNPVQAHPDQDAAEQSRLRSAYEAVESLGDPGAEKPPVLGLFEFWLGQGGVEAGLLVELAELDARLGQYEAARLNLARAQAADDKANPRAHTVASLSALLQGRYAEARAEAAQAGDSVEAKALLARAETAASEPEPEICLQPFAGLKALPPAQIIACAKATQPGDPLLETYLYALGRKGNAQHVSVLAAYLASKPTRRATLSALAPLLSPGQLGLLSPYFDEPLALQTAAQVLRRHPLQITPALQSQLLPGLLKRVLTADPVLLDLIDLIGALRAPQAKAQLQKLAAFATELQAEGRISRSNPLWNHEQDYYSEDRSSYGWTVGHHVAGALAEYTKTPLMLASAEGDLARVRQELAKKANPNARTTSGDSALSLAIANQHPETVALLLAQGAKPVLPGPEDLPPLIQAARAGQLTMVKDLLAKGADPDVRYEDTDLFKAAIDSGNPELVAWLFQRTGKQEQHSGQAGQDWLRIATKSRQAEIVAKLLVLAPKLDLSGALEEAIDQDQAEILSLLLEQGLRFNNAQDASPLISHAISSGRPEMLSLLLTRGAKPETASEGRSALLMAAGMREPIYVELLLAHGAAIDRIGPEGETALTVAVSSGNLPLVQRLLEKGANLRPPKSESPLAVAAQNPYKTEIIDYLLAKGAPIAELKPQLGPVLREAARNGRVSLVQQLLTLGPTPAELGEALLYAAYGDARDVISLLTSHGAAINYRSPDGETALFNAISRRDGGQATLSLLLELGADLNARKPDGTTPLMHAVLNGTLEQVQILIKKGASRTAKNQANQTALDLTKDLSDEEGQKIAAYLRSLK